MTAGSPGAPPRWLVRINAAAKARLAEIAPILLPDGFDNGRYWVAPSPGAPEEDLHACKLDMLTGEWSDRLTGQSGDDVVSLAAYVLKGDRTKAAIALAERLGVKPFDR